MAIEVCMPRLSDTMEEGKVLKWLKQVGEQVEIGDIIAEVETDKADMEMESPRRGNSDRNPRPGGRYGRGRWRDGPPRCCRRSRPRGQRCA